LAVFGIRPYLMESIKRKITKSMLRFSKDHLFLLSYRLRTYSEKPVQCLYNLWKKSGFLPCLMSKLYLHFYEICCCQRLLQ
jgi:hypothetical protein